MRSRPVQRPEDLETEDEQAPQIETPEQRPERTIEIDRVPARVVRRILERRDHAPPRAR